MVVWINRARAGHHSLASSLAKIGLSRDSSCLCGDKQQDLDHVIWYCPKFVKNRKKMLSLLKEHNVKPPVPIKNFLVDPNIKLLKILDDFIKNNFIHI